MSRTNYTCKYDDERHTRLREIMRRYRAKHPEIVKRENKKTRLRHRDEYIENQKQYYRDHPLAYVHHGIMKRCGLRKGATEQVLGYYAKRGIDVCEEWHSFKAFEKWALEHGYRKGLQIDRIDTNKGYSPDNCHFVSAHENAINRRSSICVIWNGERIELRRLYDRLKPQVAYSTVYERMHRHGWQLEDAMFRPYLKTKKEAI